MKQGDYKDPYPEIPEQKETLQQWAERVLPLCAECGTHHVSSSTTAHVIRVCEVCGNEHRPVDFCPPATAEKMKEFELQAEISALKERIIEAALSWREARIVHLEAKFKWPTDCASDILAMAKYSWKLETAERELMKAMAALIAARE